VLQARPLLAGGVVAPLPHRPLHEGDRRARYRPVVIDGRTTTKSGGCPPITQFREFQPKEDGDPRFATEAKVAYDDRYFYVFIRAFDPHLTAFSSCSRAGRAGRDRSAEDHGRLLPRPPLGLRVRREPAG